MKTALLKNKTRLAIFATLVCMILGMTTLKFEVVTPGKGVVVGGAGDIDVVTPDSGFINVLNVKVGDQVSRGDVIFSYNNLDVYYRNDSLNNIIAFLNNKKAELISDIKNLKVLLNHSKDFKSESIKFGDEKLGVNTERYLREFRSITRKIKELEITEKMNQSERKELNYQKDLIQSKIRLLERSNAPQVELLENRREVAQLTSSTIELDSKLLAMQVEVRNEIDGFQIGLLEKVTGLNEELHRIEKELMESKDSLALTLGKQKANVITSPVSGVILNIEKQFTVGSYIEASQKVLTIKQSQSDSLVKAKVESQYRPFINVGAAAKVAISSPGFKQSLHGQIKSISADSFIDDNNPSSNIRFYEVEVLTKESNMISSEMIGVQADIYVVSDRVTILEYITATIVENIYFGVW